MVNFFFFLIPSHATFVYFVTYFIRCKWNANLSCLEFCIFSKGSSLRWRNFQMPVYVIVVNVLCVVIYKLLLSRDFQLWSVKMRVIWIRIMSQGITFNVCIYIFFYQIHHSMYMIRKKSLKEPFFLKSTFNLLSKVFISHKEFNR